MVFSSMIFLWAFLPIVYILYILLPEKAKNPALFAASIFFYAWGEPVYVVLMLFSILLNYSAGILISRARSNGSTGRLWLIIAILINFALLAYFKYYNFAAETINGLLHREWIPSRSIPLPIGISFFTFQAVSYIIDLYRGQYPVQKNLINLGLYISFFPQLIAGPIVRYSDIDRQLRAPRVLNSTQTAQGIRRFCYGLAKKVLIANTMAMIVDRIYALSLQDISGPIALMAALMYCIQLYYDFSGYSDMAIGLGALFGFTFPENFNYPYMSRSVREFWNRWHISLGTWFREYVYIPLGGSRRGLALTCINLLIVFFLTGLWHGANITFIVWGVMYGILICLERLGGGKILDKCPILARLYMIVVTMAGMTLFRADSLSMGLKLIKRMLLFWRYPAHAYALRELVTPYSLIFLLFGILGCGILQTAGKHRRLDLWWNNSVYEIVWCACITLLSIAALVSNTYNPFIYFRF